MLKRLIVKHRSYFLSVAVISGAVISKLTICSGTIRQFEGSVEMANIVNTDEIVF